jgi:hypothetical protein
MQYLVTHNFHRKFNIDTMLKLIRIKLFFILALILCTSTSTRVLGQETETSPWSRFGMGLAIPTLSSPQLMMGGVSAPILDGYVINPDQPASAAGSVTTMLQTSLHGTNANMTEGDSTATFNSGSLGSISLVVKKPGGKTAYMMGITPYTAKGYNVSKSLNDSLTGNIVETYSGAGGTAKSYLGISHVLKGKQWIPAGKLDSVLVTSKALFLGAQASMLFGEVTSTGRLDFEDLTYLDNRTRTSMRHRSLGGLFGAQAYQLLWAKYDEKRNLKGSATLYIGATYSPETLLYTDYEKTVENVQLLSSIETVIDTASYINELDAEGRIPSKFSAGGALVYEHANGSRFLISGEYMQEDWGSISDSLFQINILDGDATWAKASRTSLGITIVPGSGGASYKAGFALDAYPIAYNGSQLSGWRASAGMTIPLEGSRSTSRLHFGVEVGHRGLESENGTVLEGTLEESLLKIQIGVTLAPFFKNLWLTPKLYD